jgi:GNAT superfamily N-acetyltransferase
MDLEQPVRIDPARKDDIGGVAELLNLRPPSYWMRMLSDDGLRAFLEYSTSSPRSTLLVARPQGEPAPAGYVFAISDPRRFWAGFALRSPALARDILYHRLRRSLELRREARRRAPASALPAFAWSPSHPRVARILGLYVRREHRRKGIAMKLYFSLFETLKRTGGIKVEEYMGPDYPQYAGRFPDACGWRIQPCSSGGYKISKEL